MKLKQPNAKTWELFKKLQALAEQGIDGEKIAAQDKLARLKARYDFDGPARNRASDLFSGRFTRSSAARWIYSFNSNELELASSVKWAIESATRINCLHRGADLLAESTAATARKLNEISDHITQNFRVLLNGFCGMGGVTAADRSAFLMGLYDGMMNEVRHSGQRLPGQLNVARKRRTKKSSVQPSAGLHVHPYSIAVGLGKQIRFSVPLEEITAELEAIAPKYLAQKQG